jgi:pyruvate kinase
LIGAKLIVNFTQTGNSTKRISKARPCCPIISVTNNRKTCLAGAWLWGVYSVLIKTSMPDFIEEMEVLALKIARDLGIAPGSPIIIAGGTPTGAGKTNFMRIVNVNQIKDLD